MPGGGNKTTPRDTGSRHNLRNYRPSSIQHDLHAGFFPDGMEQEGFPVPLHPVLKPVR